MTETVEGRTPGAVAEAKEKGREVIADAQDHFATKAHAVQQAGMPAPEIQFIDVHNYLVAG